MKKIFTVFGIAAAAVMSNAQTNLLVNPSFETGALAPWAAGTTTGYTAPVVISTDAQEGSYSASYGTLSATTGFYQNVAITGGSTYTISFWYKTSAGNSARLWSVYKNASGAAVYTTADSSTDAFRTNNKYLPVATVWTLYTATMRADSSATSLDVAVRAYASGSSSFDNFSLINGTMATSEVSLSKHALIKNTMVDSDLTFATKSSVQIFDVNGHLVKSVDVKENDKLNVSGFAKGVYIVKGIANGEKSVQKFIKK